MNACAARHWHGVGLSSACAEPALPKKRKAPGTNLRGLSHCLPAQLAGAFAAARLARTRSRFLLARSLSFSFSLRQKSRSVFLAAAVLAASTALASLASSRCSRSDSVDAAGAAFLVATFFFGATFFVAAFFFGAAFFGAAFLVATFFFGAAFFGAAFLGAAFFFVEAFFAIAISISPLKEVIGPSCSIESKLLTQSKRLMATLVHILDWSRENTRFYLTCMNFLPNTVASWPPFLPYNANATAVRPAGSRAHDLGEHRRPDKPKRRFAR